jgi:hypothetical protein
MRRSCVVLPAPVPPTSPTLSLRCTFQDTRGPPPLYDLEMLARCMDPRRDARGASIRSHIHAQSMDRPCSMAAGGERWGKDSPGN